MDIVGFGAATLDTIIVVERFPHPGEKERFLSREYHGGGLTATALVAASKLGASCWYGGALGNNEKSTKVRDFLHRYGVATSHYGAYSPEAEPISATVYLERTTGERTIFWSDSMCPHPVIGEEAMKISLAAGCVFVDGHFAGEMLPFYRLIRSKGIPMVGDFESLDTEEERRVMELVDHLILPVAVARKLTRCNSIQDMVFKLLLDFDCAAVVVTDGAKGAWFSEKTNPDVKHEPAFQVEVCDTTGCGDAFHGAYAAALTFCWNIERRIRFASAVAALTATKRGGQNGSPTRDEVNYFLSINNQFDEAFVSTT